MASARKHKAKMQKERKRFYAWWGIDGNVWRSLEQQTRRELEVFYKAFKRGNGLSLDQFVTREILECREPSVATMYYINCKRNKQQVNSLGERYGMETRTKPGSD